MAQLNTPRQTSRLTLRQYEASDLDGLTSLYSRQDVNRYLYSEPKNKDQMRSVLEAKLNRPREIIDKNVMPVAVVLRDTNRLVGDFMLRWTADQHRQGEIGGSLHPDFQGQGLAVETYAELLEIGFSDFNLHRIFGRCDGRNSASIRALEKVGLQREAHLIENEFVKGEWTDEVVLAIRRNQWLARQIVPKN
ncbi:MAG: GNAT family N-acetyltransferase [Acidimicrobiales bacterium]